MQATVLLVEDDETLRELLQFHLSQAGFRVLEAATTEAAWVCLSEASIIVLDWMLPDQSGIDWLKVFRRSEHAHLPVLMLTARASEVDKVLGLEAGADDYLVKPFSAAELIARLRALLRRVEQKQEWVVGKLKVNREQGLALYLGQPMALTRREFDLLCFLAEHPGRIFSRNDLLDRVWGEDFVGTDRTVDQHIAQLRAHIGEGYIETVRGRGYRLVNPGYDS